MHVVHRHDVIGTDRSIWIGRSATTTKVARSVKANDRCGYSNFAEHPLHYRIANNWTNRFNWNRALLFVFTQLKLPGAYRLDAAQWRRDIELHNRHHAAILGANDRLLWCWWPRLRRGFAKRKKDKRNCRKAEQNGT